MRSAAVALCAVLSVTSAAQAKQIVVHALGAVVEQSNPNHQCGASSFGLFLSARIRDSKGQQQSSSGCVGGIALPLQGAPGGNKPSQYLKFALAALLKTTGTLVPMTLLVDDADPTDADEATILSIGQ